MVEVGMGNPRSVIEGKAPGGSGQVDMKIAFEVSSEDVNGQKDTGQEAPLGSELFDDVGGERWQEVQEMAIDPEEGLKLGGQRPGDMLPDGVGEGVERGVDPMVGGFFSAGGAETGFAGMRGFDLATTGGTDPYMPAEETRSTDEHFEHIDNNRFAEEVPMGQKEPPPVAVVEEEVSEFDRTADEFHQGKIYDLNADENKSCCPLRAA
jgi:hypothetical protein